MISSDGLNLSEIVLEPFTFGVPNIQPRRSSLLPRQRGCVAQ